MSRISENGGLEFLYNTKIIEYDNLSQFIKEEFINNRTEYEEKNQKIVELTNHLEELKLIQKSKEKEYYFRQKQVSLFLECKKSFFGKIRYYFKGKKNKEQMENEEIKQDKETNTYDENEKVTPIFETKEYYTLEDLVNITKLLERVDNEIKNSELDISAIDAATKRLNKKIDNARQYIEEVEDHKKSIFEFWKFVNKDNVLALNEPEHEEEIQHNKIEKAFDFEEDYEKLGIQWDKQNREKLSKEECDGLYIASTDILSSINNLRDEVTDEFSDKIKEIKQEALKNEILFSSEEFDIFGGIIEDKTKINTMGNTKHRENKKSKFKILEINKNTKNNEFKQHLEEIIKNLDNALDKSKTNMELNVFFASENPLNTKDYIISHVNPANSLESVKEADKINLYNIKLNKNSSATALSNIVYYDNSNGTLPLGMGMDDKVIVDLSKEKLELKKQRLFRINQEINEIEVKTSIICVYEYECT